MSSRRRTTSCDCSICRKRGALIHRVPGEQVRLLTPLEDLTLYTWNTHTARDYFCPNCGILPFRRPRTARAGEWRINVRCLEDIDLDAIPIKRVFGSRLSGTAVSHNWGALHRCFRPKASLRPACRDIRASDQDRDVSGGSGLSSNTCSPGPSASASVAATNAVFAFAGVAGGGVGCHASSLKVGTTSAKRAP